MDVPDSGQEHPANSNDRLLVAATSLNSAVTLSAFRVFVGLDDSVCDLNQQRLQITSGAGDASGLYRFAALVVTRTAACP